MNIEEKRNYLIADIEHEEYRESEKMIEFIKSASDEEINSMYYKVLALNKLRDKLRDELKEVN